VFCHWNVAERHKGAGSGRSFASKERWRSAPVPVLRRSASDVHGRGKPRDRDDTRRLLRSFSRLSATAVFLRAKPVPSRGAIKEYVGKNRIQAAESVPGCKTLEESTPLRGAAFLALLLAIRHHVGVAYKT
jgi:hypothetical protein